MNIYLFKLGSVSYWDPLHYLWIWLAAILALNHIHFICITLCCKKITVCIIPAIERFFIILGSTLGYGSRGSRCDGVYFESAVTRLPLKFPRDAICRTYIMSVFSLYISCLHFACVFLGMWFAEGILCLRFIYVYCACVLISLPCHYAACPKHYYRCVTGTHS